MKCDNTTFKAQNICHRVDGVDFEMKGDGVIGRVRFKTPGKFSVYNALAAGTCAVALGLPFAGVTDALCLGPKVKGRAGGRSHQTAILPSLSTMPTLPTGCLT